MSTICCRCSSTFSKCARASFETILYVVTGLFSATQPKCLQHDPGARRGGPEAGICHHSDVMPYPVSYPWGFLHPHPRTPLQESDHVSRMSHMTECPRPQDSGPPPGQGRTSIESLPRLACHCSTATTIDHTGRNAVHGADPTRGTQEGPAVEIRGDLLSATSALQS